MTIRLTFPFVRSAVALSGVFSLPLICIGEPIGPAPIIYKTPDAPGAQTAAPSAQPPARGAGQGAHNGDRLSFTYPGAQTAPASVGSPATAIPQFDPAQPAPLRQMASLEPAPSLAPPALFDPMPAPLAQPIPASIDLDLPPLEPAPQSTSPTLAPTAYSRPGQIVEPIQVTAEDQTGFASIYSDAFEGQPTANGETYESGSLSAAHPSLPLPSLVQVSNPATGKETVVRVNDRGPFQGDGIIEVSAKAADILGLTAQGGDVEVRYLGPASTAAAIDAPAPRRIVADTQRPNQNIVDLAPPPLSVAPTPVSQVPVPVASGDYYVQVGAFSNIGNAQQMSLVFDATVPVHIHAARVNNADFFRVRVGPYASRAAAQVKRDEFARRGVADGLVVTAPAG